MEILNLIMPRYAHINNHCRDEHLLVVDYYNKISKHIYLVSWCRDYIIMPGYVSIAELGGLNNILSNRYYFENVPICNDNHHNESKLINCSIYPMDISSGICIEILFSDLLKLNPEKSVRALDLCCCPGGKLMLLTDMLNKYYPNEAPNSMKERREGSDNIEGSSSSIMSARSKENMSTVMYGDMKETETNIIKTKNLVIGVDISKQRMQVCKSILNKINMNQYAAGIWSHYDASVVGIRNSTRQLMFIADGCIFNKEIHDNGDKLSPDCKNNKDNNPVQPSSRHIKTYGELIYDNHVLMGDVNYQLKTHQKKAKDRNPIKKCSKSENAEIDSNAADANTSNLKNGFMPILKSNKSFKEKEKRFLKTSMDIIQHYDEQACLRNNKGIYVGHSVGDNELHLEEYDGFEYVLVDAQCTHDGSYRHITTTTTHNMMQSTGAKRKWIKLDTTDVSINAQFHDGVDGNGNILEGQDDFDADPCKADMVESESIEGLQLRDLQRKLCKRGFESLALSESTLRTSLDLEMKGVMIYSTCSMDIAQNELIVQWLIDYYNKHSEYKVVLLPVTQHDIDNISKKTRDSSSNVNENVHVGIERSNNDVLLTLPLVTVNQQPLSSVQSLMHHLNQLDLNGIESFFNYNVNLYNEKEGSNQCRDGAMELGLGSISKVDSGTMINANTFLIQQVANDIAYYMSQLHQLDIMESTLLPGTIYMNRFASFTSGLYIAKLCKVKKEQV